MAERVAGKGFVAVTGGRVWRRIVGAGDRIPVLALHGGPGVPHDYLEPLAGLADERAVVFYDQLGCGRSDRPDDPSLWQMERFVAEISQVREALGLTRVHLLGHSWGTTLAAEYALRQPAGLMSFILASPLLSVPQTVTGIIDLRAGLPGEVQRVLAHHEATGTTDAEEYQQAVEEFRKRHVCRRQPLPQPLQRAREEMGQTVFQAMWGPSELLCIGNLRDYDCTVRLPTITVSTLFTCGRYDERTPEITTRYHRLLPRSQMAVFEHSAHMAHLEEPEPFLQVLGDFLRQAEAPKDSQTPTA
ncbi:MAG: proline iminopeptidase-family hydrolase [Gammaproteobacteria bacterium]